jgi:phenylacetate-CoA ligase
MLDNWERVHRAAGTTKEDRIFFAFSFGPFLGFWTAFESALRIGCLTLPGGGMTSHARLRTIIELKATVLCCTPTYAIRLAEVAAEENIDLRDSPVKTLSVAGEPGGSIPAVRQELQKLWPGARVYDHHGMTEVGPVSYEDPEHPCTLRVMENAYLAEVIDPATLKPVVPGATGELVLTTLGRTGSPMLRYRTGDLVKPSQLPGENHFLALEGGILGRVDDMAVVRGVNVYPGAVEEIIRRVGGVVEYRVHVTRARAMTELAIEVEPAADVSDAAGLARRVEQALQSSLTLRIPVRAVASGALHRFEMKARRWIQEP